VSMADRECPLIIAASGPCVARARTRGLFVPSQVADRAISVDATIWLP